MTEFSIMGELSL